MGSSQLGQTLTDDEVGKIAAFLSALTGQQPVVTLTGEERTTLETFVHRGKANARTLTCARILLKSADGWSTSALAAALDV